MKRVYLVLAGLSLLCPFTTYAVDSMYCPGNHGTIRVGMNTDEVISACGQPASIVKSKQGAMIQVPVTQLMYTTLDSGAVYEGLNSTYQMWSLPSGSKGVSMQISIMDNKVSAVTIGGSGSNASTLCGGTPIQVGDPADNVYSACGSPSVVNQTFINQPIPGNKAKPEVWTYQTDPYSPPFHLTILGGILQSIN
jgi:hypothetical protein